MSQLAGAAPRPLNPRRTAAAQACQSLQEQLRLSDIQEEKTADEEQTEDNLEENELVERRAMGAVIAHTLGDLEAERNHVGELLNLARTVYDCGQDSKFDKLREVISEPRWRDQKILVFTEHRDTLDFLAATAQTTSALAANFTLDSIARSMAENHRASLLGSLPER